MKRILAITLALILALTTLSAVAVSAEDYPKTGNVVVFKDDFESYKVGSLPSTWAGGNNTTVKYSVKAGEDGNKYLAHTLNNTVVAPPRMLIAFLENNLQADGSVTIPKALRPYMGGLEKINPKK